MNSVLVAAEARIESKHHRGDPVQGTGQDVLGVAPNGKINVPYTATIRRTEGSKTHDTQVSGRYERINATSYEIKQKDLMTGEEKEMKSAPFSTATAT